MNRCIINKSCKKLQMLLLIAVCLLPTTTVLSQPAESRFTDHGVVSPASTYRGVVTTVDGEGKDVLLVWLFDVRGGYALLMIDAETGHTEQFPVPFNNHRGDSPFSSLLSSTDKFYSHFNGYFVEFDPKKRAFTFCGESAPQMAMGMTEDDQGRIWAVTYPNSGVVSFDPKTREFTDYGYVHKENWAQYQRFVATDDAGWLYFAMGNTHTQLVAFHPGTHETKAVLPQEKRKRGMAYLYRNHNGKVYGQALRDAKEDWYELYKGEFKSIGTAHQADEKPIRTGMQNLFIKELPNGKLIERLDLTERLLVIADPKTSTTKTVHFDYSSEGSWIMGVGASPDGQAIIGGSSFPMRQFTYYPATEQWGHQSAYGQYNALARQGHQAFFGSYPGGNLLVWDAQKKPQLLVKCDPVIYRPHRVLAHPDGQTIVMGGGPAYGYTGGGLLFYDLKSKKHTLLSDSNVVLDQSTMSLVPLPGRKLVGGTTIAPGTGGERKAKQGELYIIDMDTKQVEWRSPVIPNVQSYTDLCLSADGKVYGIADRKWFFVFDPDSKKLLHREDVSALFGLSVAEQSPRVFVQGPEEVIYILFEHNIGRIEPSAPAVTLVSKSPVHIRAGGDYLDGRIYFVSGSRLYSYTL
ncbi:hypothetical protein [Parapedobacter tibetensis]|uniref:hypothetical protein n=1 Tax=Parapedobacter tibetensis TaxID=2972951 RepID=UPI00214D6166|nr:hypothetical protein [Parapedobacter tibetensis]